MHQVRSFTSHSLAALLEAGIIALIVLTLVVAPALAAKGGGAGKGPGKQASTTISVVLLDSSDAVANHGERITFDVVTSATDRPFVSLKCWQGTVGVYNKSIGIFPSYLYDPWFTLDSMYWTAGAGATCTAAAYFYDKRGNQKPLASLEVIVAP